MKVDIYSCILDMKLEKLVSRHAPPVRFTRNSVVSFPSKGFTVVFPSLSRP